MGIRGTFSQAFYGNVQILKAKCHLTEFKVANPHVALEKIVDLPDSLVFKLTGLVEDKWMEMS